MYTALSRRDDGNIAMSYRTWSQVLLE